MPCFKIKGLSVLEKNTFEDFFTIYGHGGHLGHVTMSDDHFYKICSLFTLWLYIKFGFGWPSVSEKIMFIYMYIALRHGQTTTGVIFFFKNVTILLIWSFTANIFAFNYFETVFPFKRTGDQI